MASLPFNKIVRKAVELPTIKSAIGKTDMPRLYKASSMETGMLPSTAAEEKPENKGPIRVLKEGRGMGPPKVRLSTCTKSVLVRSPAHFLAKIMESGNKECLASNHKLTKIRNYKIYISRSFSSRSSSSGSVPRRLEECKRHRVSADQKSNRDVKTAGKHVSTTNNSSIKDVLKHVSPIRNLKMQKGPDTVRKTVAQRLDWELKRELMLIDSKLKSRIAVGKPVMKTAEPLRKKINVFKGLYHPTSGDAYLACVDEKYPPVMKLPPQSQKGRSLIESKPQKRVPPPEVKEKRERHDLPANSMPLRNAEKKMAVPVSPIKSTGTIKKAQAEFLNSPAKTPKPSATSVVSKGLTRKSANEVFTRTITGTKKY